MISAEDPGYANWLDTTGRRRGVLLLRFDGMNGRPFDPAKVPVARKLRLEELASVLPAQTARITPQERNAAIALRRRHVQHRLGR